MNECKLIYTEIAFVQDWGVSWDISLSVLKPRKLPDESGLVGVLGWGQAGPLNTLTHNASWAPNPSGAGFWVQSDSTAVGHWMTQFFSHCLCSNCCMRGFQMDSHHVQVWKPKSASLFLLLGFQLCSRASSRANCGSSRAARVGFLLSRGAWTPLHYVLLSAETASSLLPFQIDWGRQRDRLSGQGTWIRKYLEKFNSLYSFNVPWYVYHIYSMDPRYIFACYLHQIQI